MTKRMTESRVMWLGVGLAMGLCISYFWPHEPALAASNDRDSKFGIMTAPMGIDVEGVFLLDYLTGRMTGAVLNTRAGKFNHVYVRNVAVDFKVDPKAKPHYAFVAGRASMPGKRGVSPAMSVVYVAELSSGLTVAYGMNYRTTQRRVPVQRFVVLDSFSFREAVAKE